jgi:hypothetical protein
VMELREGIPDAAKWLVRNSAHFHKVWYLTVHAVQRTCVHSPVTPWLIPVSTCDTGFLVTFPKHKRGLLQPETWLHAWIVPRLQFFVSVGVWNPKGSAAETEDDHGDSVDDPVPRGRLPSEAIDEVGLQVAVCSAVIFFFMSCVWLSATSLTPELCCTKRRELQFLQELFLAALQECEDEDS